MWSIEGDLGLPKRDNYKAMHEIRNVLEFKTKKEGEVLPLNNFGGKSKILSLLECSVNFPRSKLDDASTCIIFLKGFVTPFFEIFR